MSVSNRTTIGFDRTIHLEWLDAAVARVVLGGPSEETRKFLWDFLEDVELGTTNNSGRGKDQFPADIEENDKDKKTQNQGNGIGRI